MTSNDDLDAARLARRAEWAAAQSRRAAICAGLSVADCADALAAAGEITKATAAAIRRPA